MKKISKKDQAELDKARGAIEAAGHAFNEAVRVFEGLRVEIFEAQDSYYSDRSEAWQESERGEAYQTWIDAYQEPICDEWDETLTEPDEYPEAPEAV